MENKEIIRKKHKNLQKVFHGMEVNYEKTIEVNNDLNLKMLMSKKMT